jgi:4-hydroxybenzoate polyprenyltransferase
MPTSAPPPSSAPAAATAPTAQPVPRPGPAPAERLGWALRVMVALSDIKIAHSVFALPFAVLAAVLARPRDGDGGTAWGAFGVALALVVGCMVAARTWAMLVNRLADHRFDAENPRTARRVIAAGRLSVRDGWAVALAFAALFVVLASGFWFTQQNPWPLTLSVPVLAWIALYSYMKRFSALCHLFLGSALAISPLAAALALDPGCLFHWTPTGQALLCLAGFILCWVAGFDIAYALQDLDFDRAKGLHSIPAALGLRGALRVARTLHTIAALCIACYAWREPGAGALTWIAVALVAGLLVGEHVVLAKRGLAGLPMAFFTLNGLASCTFGALASLDALLT